MKRSWAAALGLVLSLVCTLPWIGTNVYADDHSTAKEAELRALLQKGLTIQEIDRELEKLTAKDAKLAVDMQANEQLIEQSRTDMQEAKVKAGKVLRSYYTGERPSLVMMLVTTESLADLLKMFDYMNMIVSHDEHLLTAYKESYGKLQEQQSSLASQREEVKRIQADYFTQKERVVALQAELDALIAASSNSEEIKNQIDELNQQWKTKGLPLFDRYLYELGESFKSFEELLSTDSFKMTSLNTADFEITDKQLNDFLRHHNALFEHLDFKFKEGVVVAEGTEDGINISIKGVYKMDNKAIKFEVLGLTFNGLELPDTTVKTMNEQYASLGIDPSKVASFLTPEAVLITEGKLTIKLKMSF